MTQFWVKFLKPPAREYAIVALSVGALALDYFAGAHAVLWVAAVLGSLPTLWDGAISVVKRKVTIDVFNSFVLAVSLVLGELRSVAFIVMMLTFARLLDWSMAFRRNRAVEELLRLKPSTALRERGETLEEVPAADIRKGDIVLVKEGGRIPVDGVVVHGSAFVNESAITGESVPVERQTGNSVFSSTLTISGTIKIKATKVGRESTVEQIAALIQNALAQKSRSEKVADQFAEIFLPVILLVAGFTYFFTRDISMTSAVILIACVDDIAVSIPLAMAAAIGRAAKRGVIVKGGEWLDALSKIKTVVVDKTGTLTYGDLHVERAMIAPGISEQDFWIMAGIVEKFSDHPVGRAIYQEASRRVSAIPDPDEFESKKGSGTWATYKTHKIISGNADVFLARQFAKAAEIEQEIKKLVETERASVNAIAVGDNVWGYVVIRDVPRVGAKKSIARLKDAGVARVVMFTGDARSTAERIASELGISEVRSEMKPEDKVKELEAILASGASVAMVGDGVNDAPALARSDVGIAMGGAGTAVAIEAADVVILTDKLDRVPEMILLGKKTLSVIRGNTVLWVVLNIIGFALVFTGFAGPAIAAFYNFVTDFFPLLNSMRLFAR